MNRFTRSATERTPEIILDFSTGAFSIRGESYPEDVAAFYGPVMSSLKAFLDFGPQRPLKFDIELIYFNSSSAKVLMNLFMLLENAAEGGSRITVNWYYLSDDDTMREFGEEFSEDVRRLEFRVLQRDATAKPK